jgi:hypothetical protein
VLLLITIEKTDTLPTPLVVFFVYAFAVWCVYLVTRKFLLSETVAFLFFGYVLLRLIT